MTEIDDYFRKLDSEIAQAVARKQKYFYKISEPIPCTPKEIIQYYLQYTVEVIPLKCNKCVKKKYDIIINLI
jgi:hypothetical protein